MDPSTTAGSPCGNAGGNHSLHRNAAFLRVRGPQRAGNRSFPQSQEGVAHKRHYPTRNSLPLKQQGLDACETGRSHFVKDGQVPTRPWGCWTEVKHCLLTARRQLIVGCGAQVLPPAAAIPKKRGTSSQRQHSTRCSITTHSTKAGETISKTQCLRFNGSAANPDGQVSAGGSDQPLVRTPTKRRAAGSFPVCPLPPPRGCQPSLLPSKARKVRLETRWMK